MAGAEIPKRVQEVMDDTGMLEYQAVSHLKQRDIVYQNFKKEQRNQRNKLSEATISDKQVMHTGHPGPVARNK